MAFDSEDTPASSKAACLFGLVLAGGQSQRMGSDKGQLMYNGRRQVDRAFSLLEPFCVKTFVSLDRQRPGYESLPLIADEHPHKGPAGGLSTAWRHHPNVAWLSVAVDMPRLDAEAVARLVEARDASKIATAYRHSDGTVEPLCAIWEPAAADLVRKELGDGRGSLRTVLETSGPKFVVPLEPLSLESIDSVARYEDVRRELSDQPADESADE